MSDARVTYRFPYNSDPIGQEVDRNFDDLVSYLKTFVTTQTYAISTSSDTTGPTGNSMMLLMRDTTAGGSVCVLYEAGQTPSIVAQIAGGGVTYVTAAPGAGEVQVKNNGSGDGVDFRAGTGQDGDNLNVTVFYAQTA